MPLYPWSASRSAFRGLAQDYIFGGVLRNYTSSQIINGLKELSLTYHAQDMYSDINWWREAVSDWSNINYTNYNKLVSSRFYLPTQSVHEGMFQTTLMLKYQDPDTGEVVEQPVTLIHRNPDGTYATEQTLTRGEIINQADKLARVRYSKLANMVLVKATVVKAVYNPYKL